MRYQTLISMIVLGVSGAAFAQAPAPMPAPKDPVSTPRIVRREAHQEKRIEQGVASGQLTPREAKCLEAREASITKAQAHAKADGAVTRQERVHLTRMENKESRHIAREKHDAQKVRPAKS